LLSDILDEPPIVEASRSNTKASNDKTPIIFATTKAIVLSVVKYIEASRNMLKIENNIGQRLKPKTYTP
jgi:hypothetical protein